MTRTVTLRVTIADEGDPPYEQLRDAIRTKIERGTFGPGDRLPPVRVAAAALGLAPNTVARAYRELESDGWLEGRGRAGTFVPNQLPRPEDPADALDAAVHVFLRRARELGFDRAAAIDALRSNAGSGSPRPLDHRL